MTCHLVSPLCHWRPWERCCHNPLAFACFASATGNCHASLADSAFYNSAVFLLHLTDDTVWWHIGWAGSSFILGFCAYFMRPRLTPAAGGVSTNCCLILHLIQKDVPLSSTMLLGILPISDSSKKQMSTYCRSDERTDLLTQELVKCPMSGRLICHLFSTAVGLASVTTTPKIASHRTPGHIDCMLTGHCWLYFVYVKWSPVLGRTFECCLSGGVTCFLLRSLLECYACWQILFTMHN